MRRARSRHRRLGALAPLVLAAAASAHCSSTPAGPAPCESVYMGRCGGACTTTSQCPTGQYCGADGRCTADCATGARGCNPGQLCTVAGRCLTVTGADTGAPGDGSVPPEDACAAIDVQLGRQPPTLLLLIDQSGSMTGRFGNTTRWNAIRQTLIDPAMGVVQPLQSEVRFGLAMYTSRGGSAGGTCPLLTPPLMAALDNYNAIRTAMMAASPVGDTPTAESVRASAQILAADPSPGLKAIVLATDGEPDTCADPNAGSTPAGLAMARQGSVDAVRAAFAQGIHTYVVSVGADVSATHMQDLANAGAGTSGAMFYRALDPAALTDAFRTITAGVRSCTFSVRGMILASAASSGDVRLDGAPLLYNDANGWRLTSPSQIELQGTACQRVRTTASALTARFPCDAVTPG